MKGFSRRLWLIIAILTLFPSLLRAEEAAARIDLTQHPVGYLALLIFFVAYGLVAVEQVIQLRKSKPVMLAAGLIWALLGLAYAAHGQSAALEAAARHVILDYGELMLFLVVAITYVNTMQERRVFHALRAKLVSLMLSYRQLFWLVGGLAFVFGPVIDNLTTALVMGALVVAVGVGHCQFIVLGCIIIVVAANAGGVFSPFGDITSLMVWQKGKLKFLEFFHLFVPSLVNFLVPAACMHFSVPKGTPEPANVTSKRKPGAVGVVWLFAATIATAVSFKSFLSLPPALGMMLGLGYLQMYSYVLQRIGRRRDDSDIALDSFRELRRVEWDTLLFFFGIIFAVAGLGVAGYIAQLSNYLYVGMGPTVANIAIGVLGAAFDNIPLMFAVLTMNPDMSSGVDGAHAQPIHVCQPPSMVLGHCARLCRKHRHPPVGQRPAHVVKKAAPLEWLIGRRRERRGPSARDACTVRRRRDQHAPPGAQAPDRRGPYAIGSVDIRRPECKLSA